MWQRPHSQSNPQSALDEVIRNLEEYITEDYSSLPYLHHYSSNDSAMGDSELVISPVQSESTSSEPCTLNRKRQVFHSTDSAFSNNSSPTNSSDCAEHNHRHSEVLSSNYLCNHYVKMQSDISTGSHALPIIRNTSSPAPAPITLRHMDPREQVQDKISTSLPWLSHSDDHSLLPSCSSSITHTTQSSNSTMYALDTPNSVTQLSVSEVSMHTHHQHSAMLDSMDHSCSYSDTKLDCFLSDQTPTESALHISSSPSGLSLDSSSHGSIDRNAYLEQVPPVTNTDRRQQGGHDNGGKG